MVIVSGQMLAGHGTRESVQDPWTKKGLQNEQLEKRSRTSKHFIKDNDEVAAFFSTSSIHYLDAKNKWQEIGTEIESNPIPGGDAFPFVALKNAVRNFFPSNPFLNHLVLETNEGIYRERLTSIKFLDASGTVISSMDLSGSVSVQVDHNKISYSGFDPDLSLVYTLGSDSRKFDLQINSSSFLNRIPNGAKYLRIEEEFMLPDKTSAMGYKNDLITVSTAGTEIFSFSRPVAFDSNPSREDILNGEIEFRSQGEHSEVYSTFDLNWLIQPGRQFPVHFDPIVNYYPQNSSNWTGYQTSSASKSSGMLRLTNNTTSSWAKFDLTTLPIGASVAQATYFGYHYQTTGVAKIASIQGLGVVDPVTAAAAALFTASQNGTVYNSNYTFGSNPYGWNSGSFNASGIADVAAAAGYWIAIGFKYLSGNTTFMYQYGYNASSAANRPYLEVDYSTTPCAGIPAANTVITPTAIICPGSSANIGLANSYTVGGLIYTWQSSTVSAVGPWIAIPSASSAAITSPTINVPTWFSAIITCTNGNGSVTATAGSVNVVATTTSSIPYFESFEGISDQNKLPNCSWAASNIPTTCQTHTTVQTQNLSPHTGNNFASFYYSPASDNFFWTNGIWMEAGVTYSASMWYKTEYYTYPTWQLKMWVGPTQSTTNANVIASSGGPGSAASAAYKLLSETFTVTASGYYYVGINGISNGVCCGYYLSWDDLEITIPCDLNTPPVMIAANTLSICQGQNVNLTASGADTYLWNTGATSNAISVSPASTSSYTVIGTSAISGCSLGVSQEIVVHPSPVTGVFSTGQSVCLGSNINLIAFGAINYLWNNGQLDPVISVSPNSNTTYTVLGSNVYGCSSTATIAIAVLPLPQVSISSSNPNDLACETDQTQLSYSGNGATTFTWLTQSALFAGNPVNVNPGTTTTYTLIASSALGCTNQAVYTLNVMNCVGLDENTDKIGLIELYPNPFQDELILRKLTGKASICLMDVSGKEILNFCSDSAEVHLYTGDLSKGLYFARIQYGQGTITVKVLKD
ncbi:MAG TPA: T9SS type A sorting domain-containing protein [Bacteroidia bacterium]|nr:T9SS type A sorting domain-containing protein [Bacteroidia bacterium]